MRTIEEYMKLPYRIELIPDPDEGGFVVTFPDLPGCLSVGETIEDGIAIPEPDSIEDYSGQFKLRLPRSLHRQLALQSKREGVSMNQYCVYLLSQNNAARA